MLTRPVAAVKFDVSSTPEQAACDEDGRRTQDVLERLVEHMQHAAADTTLNRFIRRRGQTPIFRNLLVIGNWLLQAFLDMAGTGDVGPTLRVASGYLLSDRTRTCPGWSNHRRPLSVDLRQALERTCYGQDRVEAALDAQVSPAATPVFVLAPAVAGVGRLDDAHAEAIRKLGTFSAGDHRESVGGPDTESRPAMSRGVSRPPSGSGRCRGRTALGGDSGLQGGTPGAQGAAAGRGVRHPTANPGEPARGKGEKANQKKMAAVGAVYTIEPFVRTADDVIEEVMRKKARERRPRPRTNGCVRSCWWVRWRCSCGWRMR